MTKIKYEIIYPTEETITLLKQIRFNAYQINTTDFNPATSYHANELRKDKY